MRTPLSFALAAVGTHAAVEATVILETRFVTQASFSRGANSLQVVSHPNHYLWNDGARLTVQYRLRNTDPSVVPLGLESFDFDIVPYVPGSGTTPGLSYKSKTHLYGMATGATPQARGEAYSMDPSAYATAGTGAGPSAADYRYGLHGAFRAGLTDPDGPGSQTPNDDPSNGVLSGTSLHGIKARTEVGAQFPTPTQVMDGALWTGWHNLYSFEVQAGGLGDVVGLYDEIRPKAMSPQVVPTFQWRDSNGQVHTGDQFLNGQSAITVAFESSPPTVTAVNVGGSPNNTATPDFDRVLIAYISDTSTVPASNIDVSVMGATPANNPSFTVEQVEPNVVAVYMSYEIANADLANGPSSFMVKITAMESGAAGTAQGTLTVFLVPAPSAAMLLASGMVFRRPRRRGGLVSCSSLV